MNLPHLLKVISHKKANLAWQNSALQTSNPRDKKLYFVRATDDEISLSWKPPSGENWQTTTRFQGSINKVESEQGARDNRRAGGFHV